MTPTIAAADISTDTCMHITTDMIPEAEAEFVADTDTDPCIDEFVDEVSSWIHDERRCVTTQTVAWTFGLSRRQASQLLKRCCSSTTATTTRTADNAKSSYRVVSMQIKETECDSGCDDGIHITQTVIQMAKSTLLHGEIQQVQDAVYAISLDTCTESLETAAHPKDMQLFRDALASFQHATVLNHNCADIQSSIPLMRENVGHFQQERRNHMGQEATKQPGVTAATSATDKNNSSNNTANNNTRKTTTAQAFFRGPSATTTAPTTTAAVQPTHAITSTKSKKPFFGTSSTHSTTVSTTRTHKNETSVSVAPRDKEKLRTTSTTKSAVLPADKNSCIPEEKENARNATVIGTADDFMGDEDEDEEFLQQEKLRQDRRLLREGKAVSSSQQEQRGRPKVQQQQQQQPRSKPISTTNVDTKSVHKDDNREEEEQQQQQHQPVVSGKKRRKKLVEKTTMDEHGYMHTETHVEWEEISVVDEPPAAVVEKKVIKNTKNMKQGSLMGFFSKK